MIGPKGPCGWTHYAAMAVTTGSRFSREGITGYVAKSGGSVRANRESAIADECTLTHRVPA